MNQLADTVTFVERKNNLFSFLSFLPFQVFSRRNLKNVKVKDLVYDWLIIESDYCAHILSNKSIRFNKLFITVSNNESLYFKNLGFSVFPNVSTLYYWIESLKFHYFSNVLYKRADLLAFVSSSELSQYEKNVKYRAKKTMHILSQFDIDKFKSYSPKSNFNVLFVGSLFMPNNLHGLKWYLSKIHPNLLHIEKYKLIIVGSTGSNPKVISELTNYFKHFSNLEFHFDVEQLDQYYDNACVFINPMLRGAGIKVKTLQAIQYGLPVVTTECGAEGLGFTNNLNMLISDNPLLITSSLENLFYSESKRSLLVFESQKHLINKCSNQLFVDHLMKIK